MDVGVESLAGVKTAPHTYGSGFIRGTPMLPKGVDGLDAGFRRDISSLASACTSRGGIRRTVLAHTSEVTAIMSNPNDPRDASLETRVTFPKSWGRDEAG